jgi:acyl-CoA dehydrogenase
VSAVLLAWEGTRDPADARRALLSRMVLEHRLAPRDPLAREERSWEEKAIDLLLAGRAVPMAEAAGLLT